MIKTAVIFANYGPYHMAWSKSLSEVDGVEPCFIELASEQKKYHPWLVQKDIDELSIWTLVEGVYEQTPLRKLYSRLIQTLEYFNPEVVVVPGYSPPIMLAAAWWAKRHGATAIMVFASTAWDYKRVWWKELFKSFLVSRYYDAGFVGGVAARDYLKSLGMPEEYIWGQHDAVDNAYFNTKVEQVLQIPGEYRERTELPQRYFLYVGRFSPEKNLRRLLEAYRRYRDIEPEGWRLVMVGDGPQRQQLVKEAERLGLKDVIWTGFRQIEKLPAYYALADALILPSTREPWGLVVNEAMASGLPVLVSNRCGSAWDLVFEGKNGYTFDPHSIEGMLERMLKLSRSHEAERRAMGAASRKIISGYSLERRSESLADCIKQTLASREN